MASAGDFSERPIAHLLFILGVAVVATSLPKQAYAIIDSKTGLAIGLIGLWLALRKGGTLLRRLPLPVRYGAFYQRYLLSVL